MNKVRIMYKAIFIFLLLTSYVNLSFGAADTAKVGRAKLAMASTAKRQNPSSTQDMLKSYLKLSSFKHKVLAQNLANLNTPGYKADDVEMPTTTEELNNNSSKNSRFALKRTSEKHLSGTSGRNGGYSAQKLKDPFEIKPNGNNVSMQQQIMKTSQNQTNYDIALQAYKSTNTLINAALGKQQ